MLYSKLLSDSKIQRKSVFSVNSGERHFVLVKMLLRFPSSAQAHRQLKGRYTGGFTGAAGAHVDAA